MIRKTGIAALILVSIAVFMSCNVPMGGAPKEPTLYDAGTIVGNTYRNEELGFSITAPPTWNISIPPRDSLQTLVILKSRDTSGSFTPTVNVVVDTTDPQVSCQAYMIVAREEFSNDSLWSDFAQVGEAEGNTVGGKSACDLQFTATYTDTSREPVRSFNVRLSQVIVPYRRSLVVITTADLQSMFDLHKEDFGKIRNSVQFF
jgi:hypothetical protein